MDKEVLCERDDDQSDVLSNSYDSGDQSATAERRSHGLLKPSFRRTNRVIVPANRAVLVHEEELVIPTYLPGVPEQNPMFLEKRVYQGSSGAVYPLPFTDRISEAKVDRKWKTIWIENEFVRVMILPEIGGRIHAIQDKTNGYDLIYNQSVIKPALVGLAGPWASGGIEFNWPQHHRPATFLPMDFEIETHADGSKTVWCSDHDPMCRMKGMHGVCLHPDKALVELKVRAYNRTPFVQTFLWWANVATRVHEAYQSFFPPDVYYVADHARRSMSEYPLAKGFYYGVNYGKRGRSGIPPNEIPRQFIPPHCRDSKSGIQSAKLPHYASNDLSFYANIPTTCSYMCVESREDFFGGYDFKAQAGVVHIANHHIAPGKKQWTWGNYEFGYAWDRNLTEADETGEYAPYIEIMSGVYTDNQPDFSFLQPGETKSWSQFWYPIQKIGPVQHANLRAAVHLKIEKETIRAGIAVTQSYPKAKIQVLRNNVRIAGFKRDLTPGAPFVEEIELPDKVSETDLQIIVTDRSGGEIISYQPKPRVKGQAPAPATEPLPPSRMSSADELFITGLHLCQYRHATRCPTLYWREALRRDPLDARCNNAMGLWHLCRGEWATAEKSFRVAIKRLTCRNANPYDGEAFYNLGLCLRFQLDAGARASTRWNVAKANAQGDGVNPALRLFEDAYAAFYKATWNRAWAAAGFHALAEMDCRCGDWAGALEHLNRSLRFDTDNLRARDLKTVVLRKLNRLEEAEKLLRETLSLDPLDWWARSLAGAIPDDGNPKTCDLQVWLDIAHDFARAGLYAEAAEMLENVYAVKRDLPDQNWGAMPLIFYTRGWLHEKLGDESSALRLYRRGAAEQPNYCFPSRLEEILILESALRANPKDARAPYYLGNLLYDRRRHAEAIGLWEQSARLDPAFSVVWRNLGIGWFNILKKPAKARMAYEKAYAANPADARLLFERDQLWKRLGEKPGKRLRELEKFPQLTSRRDDLSVELCVLYNQTGQHKKALKILAERKFQPWEGGEGAAMGQHVRTHLALGRALLQKAKGEKRKQEAASAMSHFKNALASPENLGEAKHILANQSDIYYWLGVAYDLIGDKKSAREHWRTAAMFRGDFQGMSVRAFSELTFYSALAWEKLGQKAKAKKLFRELLAYALKLQKTPAKIEYFATSLPTMLLFDDDLQFRQETTAIFLQAQARLGLGQKSVAKSLLQQVLRRDPNHTLAADFGGFLNSNL